MSTSGVFGCGPVFGITYTGGTCASDGTSVSITSAGGQTLTVSFIGLTNVPLIATLDAQIIDVGIIQTTLTGPGTFFFREPTEPWWYPFQFSFGIDFQTSVPVNDLGLWFKSVSPTTVVADYPFPAPGPGVVRNNVVPPYSLVFSAPAAGPLTAGGSTKVSVVVGLFAPEPATIILTATGLFVIAGIAFLRKRGAERASVGVGC